MAFSFSALPIRRKLTLLVTASGALAVALACAAFLTYFVVSYRERLVMFSIVASRMIGENTAGALAMNDPEAAERVLASLSSSPHTRLARIFSRDGRAFATYRRSGVTNQAPDAPGPDGHRFTLHRLINVEGIYLGPDRIGTIYVVEDLAALYQAMGFYLGIASLVLLMGVFAAFASAALFQRIISDPILDLARAASEISGKGDYSIRVARRTQDELGALADSFNSMLDQIQARDRALRASQTELRDIMDFSPALIFTKRLDGGYIYLNKRYQQVSGWTQEEIIGRKPDDLWPSEFAGPIMANDRATLETGGPITFEERLPGRDGAITLLSVKFALRDASGAPYALCGIAIDITDRKRSEERVRRALSLFEATLESTFDAILVVDRAGKIESFNRRFIEVWGLPDDILASGDDKLALSTAVKRVKDPEGFLAKVNELYSRPEEESFDVFEMKDGRVIERSSKPQRLGTEIVGRVWTFRDVTERRRAEAEVHRLNAALERRVAERTAELRAANQELESFSYSTSHDLRAPLRSIDGFSTIVLQEYGDQLGSRGRALLERIRKATLRMAAIIDDMLSLSRVTRSVMRRETVDITALARDVVEGLRRAEPGRHVEVRIQPGLKARGDPSLLRLMLENLLGNAWKYSSKNPHSRIELGMTIEGGHPVFHVRDNGVGFDPRYAGKLFQPFVRLHTSEEFPGTGVGLTIVSRIVSRHGGRVWGEGEVGKGAAFHFALQDRASGG